MESHRKLILIPKPIIERPCVHINHTLQSYFDLEKVKIATNVTLEKKCWMLMNYMYTNKRPQKKGIEVNGKS